MFRVLSFLRQKISTQKRSRALPNDPDGNKSYSYRASLSSNDETQVSGGEASALDIYANNSSDFGIQPEPMRFSDTQIRNFMLRAWLWHNSVCKRTKKCGRISRGGLVSLDWNAAEGSSRYSGLCSCASVWSDPVCSSRINYARGQELGRVLEWCRLEGIPVALGTLTLSHNKSQPLDLLADALQSSWGAATSGAAWQRDNATFGTDGRLAWMRVAEVTWGENGWHPHLHALFFGAGLSADTLEALSGSMFGRFSRKAVQLGLAPPRAIGQNFQMVSDVLDGTPIAEYLAKGLSSHWDAGRELMGANSKRARGDHGTIPMIEMLQRAATGDLYAKRIYNDYEAGMFRRRQMTKSGNFLDVVGVPVLKKDDEELCMEVTSGWSKEIIFALEGLRSLTSDPAFMVKVRVMREMFGLEAALELLFSHGVQLLDFSGSTGGISE